MAVMRFDPFRDLDRLTEQMLGVPVGSTSSPPFHADGPVSVRRSLRAARGPARGRPGVS